MQVAAARYNGTTGRACSLAATTGWEFEQHTPNLLAQAPRENPRIDPPGRPNQPPGSAEEGFQQKEQVKVFKNTLNKKDLESKRKKKS